MIDDEKELKRNIPLKRWQDVNFRKEPSKRNFQKGASSTSCKNVIKLHTYPINSTITLQYPFNKYFPKSFYFAIFLDNTY